MINNIPIPIITAITKVPAEIWKIGDCPGKIYISRNCPIHGSQVNQLMSDARFYSLAQGDREGSDCGGGTCCSVSGDRVGTVGSNAHPAERLGVIEQLSTCTALIEIVNSCNMHCPTCFADSPVGIGAKVDAVPLDEIKGRIQGVIDRKGTIELVQLSGGEPTLHPEFFELLEWLHRNPGVLYTLVNTNGVRIAKDTQFLKRLRELYSGMFNFDSLQLYLQFDGLQEAGQKELSGADMREVRKRAIDRCAEFDLPITLAMRIIPENVDHVWETIEFGLKYSHIRGVAFQPQFTSGRIIGNSPVSRSIDTAAIILSAVEHSGNRLRMEDFTALPCGDPNCATIGWIFRVGNVYMSPAESGIDLVKLQAMVPDRIHYSLEDLKRCGCENTELGELIKQLELKESNAFRLVVKPFMDASTWDEDRIARCCTHVIRPDGRLDSFCRYYSGFPGTYHARETRTN